MKTRMRVGIVWILLAIGWNVSAQTGVARAEALFIYNFSRLIEWPANYKSGPFIIGVLGNNTEIIKELESYTAGKSVGSQAISIRVFNSVDEVMACHTLFLPFPEAKNLPAVLSKTDGKSTLVITEKNGSIEKGAGINFIVIGDKLKFEFSPANISKNNIKVSSKLNEMAYKVY